MIHTYVDTIMEKLVELLEIEQPPYSLEVDPTKKAVGKTLSWDFAKSVMSNTKRMYLDRCSKAGKRSSQGKVGKKEAKIPKVDVNCIESLDLDAKPVKKESLVVDGCDRGIIATANNDAGAIVSGKNSIHKIESDDTCKYEND